ncbi:hypothetical protein HY989_00660 [Candidatus Micrarchaeota archaeon]|nr:hypothetical protein [Candidatus Micrarchaeota archaeon]
MEMKKSVQIRMLSPEEIAKYKKRVIKDFGVLSRANKELFAYKLGKSKIRKRIPEIDEIIAQGKKRQARRLRLGLYLARGNKTGTAHMFGISSKTVSNLVKKYNLQNFASAIEFRKKQKKPSEKLMTGYDFSRASLAPEIKDRFLKSVLRNFGNLHKASKEFYKGSLSRDELRRNFPKIDEYVEKGKKQQERRLRLALHFAMGNVSIAAKILRMSVESMRNQITKYRLIYFKPKLKSANITELETMIRKMEARLAELKKKSTEKNRT